MLVGVRHQHHPPALPAHGARVFPALALLSLALVAPLAVQAQVCTTQAKMTDVARASLAAAAETLASDVLTKDTTALKALTAPDDASNAEATAFLVRTTGDQIAGDRVTVREIFLLDATDRKTAESAETDFSCALSGSASEVDFAINGLPPGKYGFALVEATGPRPWLLAFLLREEGTGWRMAGFYPHPREAAGHDGLWYWTAAREHGRAGQKWVAWTFYSEADRLLRPAGFATTSHLDQLLTEQRNGAPGEVSDGVSPTTPLVLKGANGGDFRITSLEPQGSEDGKRLNLMVHLAAESAVDPAATRDRNLLAARALLVAHPELRGAFAAVWVFGEAPGSGPVVAEYPMDDLAR